MSPFPYKKDSQLQATVIVHCGFAINDTGKMRDSKLTLNCRVIMWQFSCSYLGHIYQSSLCVKPKATMFYSPSFLYQMVSDHQF